MRRAYEQLVVAVQDTKHVNHPRVWKSIALYHDTGKYPEEAFECRLKQSRTLLASNWQGDKELFEQLVEVSLQLTEAWRATGDETSLNSATMHLRSIVKNKTALDIYADTPEYQQLSEALASVSQ